jgi:hypothetical protein
VFNLFSELMKGESAGLSSLHMKQTEASLVLARQNLAETIADYRNDLERFKVAIGLSVHAPVVPDREIVASFGRVFDQTRGWQERPDRSHRDLPRIIKGLPALGEVVVEGRSILALMGGNPDQQEEAPTLAARVAIGNRGDLDKAPRDAAAVELDIRRRIRRLFGMRRDYEAHQRIYELDIRLIDQGLEQTAAPPMLGVGAPSRSTMFVGGVVGLLAPETQRRKVEDQLVTIWTSFQTERLALYRELGILPYDDWKSFFNDLSAR